MLKVIYFKFKLKDVVTYQRALQQTNIKFLEKCKINGYKHILTNKGYVYFCIENQLYRLLKLSYLDNQTMEHNMRSLDLILKKSIRIDKSDVPHSDYGQHFNYYWYKSETQELNSNEIALKKSEFKERLRNHNRYYNQKYKLKR